MYSPQHLFKILCNLKAASLHECKWRFPCHSCAYLKQECLALTDAQAHHDFLRVVLCGLTKGKITPAVVLVGVFKCEVHLELSCSRCYGLVCRLTHVKIWLERLWCGSGGVLTWLMCCRWAGRPWDMGGTHLHGEPLGVGAWPCGLEILYGLGTLLCLPLPWGDAEIYWQCEKRKLLDWNQEWW